ncbi:glucoamylase family protein [Draconibacterium halophilum]|uniref:glucoamylase family protein n=1 Tax=Draconibacterium halophilum TaxID=2706887 RepID=UPI001FE7D63B|nr:glucoamylase family protein [Draconibacterium halophilum]
MLLTVTIVSCSKVDSEAEKPGEDLAITYAYIGETALTASGQNTNITIDETIEIRFNAAVNMVSAEASINLFDAANNPLALTFSYFNNNQLVKIDHQDLDENATYTLTISSGLKGANEEPFKGQTYTFSTLTSPLVLESVQIDEVTYNPLSRILDINRKPVIRLQFNSAVSKDDISLYSSYSSNGTSVASTFNQLDEQTISVEISQEMEGFSKTVFAISSNIENRIDRPFEGLELNFYTQADTTPKFPVISDEELLTLVQRQTFNYFWDFAHPVSGLARERNTSGNTVTTGGSGFGVMSILVGIERGFITRQQGIDRLETIVEFLTDADRFHGVWPHWLNGETGKTIPFSSNDDGGDLVETAFMMQGLLTVRQYLNSGNSQESSLINKINTIWETIEWDWYTQGGQDVLYWHWSPNNDWAMNMKIRGWNEALIIYVLAASSPTHTIGKDVYTKGWARDGNMMNTDNNSFYGYTLPLRNDMGGPLFFSHYSFLGLDPRNLSDQYANYWEQNVTHTKINQAYCADNPQNYVAYSNDCWGLTASDGYSGYSAHSPNNDRGVLTPTAALSSMPYTPEESMKALHYFYYTLGDKLWGDYGFYDAFDFTNGWVADSYLAIDQGPIVVMIENYRTNLLWDLFMSCPEVQSGLTKLDFTY